MQMDRTVNIMLNEVSHSEKQTLHVFSQMWMIDSVTNTSISYMFIYTYICSEETRNRRIIPQHTKGYTP
jgi:hypothetical protein